MRVKAPEQGQAGRLEMGRPRRSRASRQRREGVSNWDGQALGQARRGVKNGTASHAGRTGRSCNWRSRKSKARALQLAQTDQEGLGTGGLKTGGSSRHRGGSREGASKDGTVGPRSLNPPQYAPQSRVGELDRRRRLMGRDGLDGLEPGRPSSRKLTPRVWSNGTN